MQTSGSTSTPTFEDVKLVLSIVGFLVGVVSIFLVYIQMRKTHEWNRRKASHDTLSELVTGHVAEFRQILIVTFGMEPSTSQRFTDVDTKHPQDEDRRKLRYYTAQLLNYLEVLCVGMKNNVLDENICYDYAKHPVTRFWIWAEPFVKARREATGDETLWIEVENFSKSWLEREERERSQHRARLRVPGKRPT